MPRGPATPIGELALVARREVGVDDQVDPARQVGDEFVPQRRARFGPPPVDLADQRMPEDAILRGGLGEGLPCLREVGLGGAELSLEPRQPVSVRAAAG